MTDKKVPILKRPNVPHDAQKESLEKMWQVRYDSALALPESEAKTRLVGLILEEKETLGLNT